MAAYLKYKSHVTRISFNFYLPNMNHLSSLSAPKRVLLNVKSLKSDEEVVKAFLRYSQRPEDDYERNVHYIHLDPDRNGQESWSHIVLDMNAGGTPDCDLKSVPHEIYKARSANPDGDL